MQEMLVISVCRLHAIGGLGTVRLTRYSHSKGIVTSRQSDLWTFRPQNVSPLVLGL